MPALFGCYRQVTPPGSDECPPVWVLSTFDPSGVRRMPALFGCYRQVTPPGSDECPLVWVLSTGDPSGVRRCPLVSVLSTGDPSGVRRMPALFGCYRQVTPPGSDECPLV